MLSAPLDLCENLFPSRMFEFIYGNIRLILVIVFDKYAVFLPVCAVVAEIHDRPVLCSQKRLRKNPVSQIVDGLCLYFQTFVLKEIAESVKLIGVHTCVDLAP